ncbi:MAG: hypothetical protein M1832_003466 [Thelocarpon impressellum]|nr:MAG: hypothetical protein M1832_003466 [Thelocarpon impressellum]
MDAPAVRPSRSLIGPANENVPPQRLSARSIEVLSKPAAAKPAALAPVSGPAMVARTAFGDVSNTAHRGASGEPGFDPSAYGAPGAKNSPKAQRRRPAPGPKQQASPRNNSKGPKPPRRQWGQARGQPAAVQEGEKANPWQAFAAEHAQPPVQPEAEDAPVVRLPRPSGYHGVAIFKDASSHDTSEAAAAAAAAPAEEQEEEEVYHLAPTAPEEPARRQKFVTVLPWSDDKPAESEAASVSATVSDCLSHEPICAKELATVADITEPAEYWSDEADEEADDDDGWATARSISFRGDDTTGNVPVVCLPKPTGRDRRELALAKQVVEASRDDDEVHEESLDVTMVAEYGEEIFAYYKELEMKMLPDAQYMDGQAEIQWPMRAVLVEWIMQVHHRFNLLPETLFHCVNLIDRFLSLKVVSLGKLQLVGATAIFISSKYEEVNCPSVAEIAYMVDGGYTEDEILKAERFMLSMLQFELGWPGPMSFLRRISKADDYDAEIRTLAKYFLEVASMDERFVALPASLVAAASHCLARLMLRKGDWTAAHVHYSGYTFHQLRQLLTLLHECCGNAREHHQVVYDKYADRRYQRASLFAEGQMQKGFRLPESSAFSGIGAIAGLWRGAAASSQE